MTVNLAMALLGAMGATVAAIASALVFIIASSKNAGRREGKLDDALTALHDVKTALKEIPELKMRIGQLETLYGTIHSDIRELKGLGPSTSIRMPRSPSSPDFGGGKGE